MDLLHSLSAREGYTLLLEILALPGCPWKHRVLPYGQVQSAIVNRAVERLSAILDNHLTLLEVSVVLDKEGILSIFSSAIADGRAAKCESISDFMWNTYSCTSIFLDYYRRDYCEDTAIRTVLKKHSLYDSRAVELAFELKEWYITHRTALSQLNPGSWELNGLHDWEAFLDLYVATAKEKSNPAYMALKPNGYGMFLVDRGLLPMDIKLLFKEEEYTQAEMVLRASHTEKHKAEYSPTCPISAIGDFGKEMEWRMSHDRLTRERMEKHGVS